MSKHGPNHQHLTKAAKLPSLVHTLFLFLTLCSPHTVTATAAVRYLGDITYFRTPENEGSGPGRQTVVSIRGRIRT